MSTGTSLIEDALKEIQVISVAVPSSPEQITHGLDKLNSMIQGWLSKGIKMQTVPITKPGEDLNEPEDARNAIVTNLAITLAATYKAQVVDTLRNDARSSYEDVKALYQEISIPEKVVSSTTPRGAGNKPGIFEKTFFSEGGTVSG